MSLALVKLSKKRDGIIYYFIDYISYDIARLGIQIQGVEHNEDEWSNIEILKVFNRRN